MGDPVIAGFLSLCHTFNHASELALFNKVSHRHDASQHHPSHTRCLRIVRLILPTRVSIHVLPPEILGEVSMFCVTTI